jgi:hypothetical protein
LWAWSKSTAGSARLARLYPKSSKSITHRVRSYKVLVSLKA